MQMESCPPHTSLGTTGQHEIHYTISLFFLVVLLTRHLFSKKRSSSKKRKKEDNEKEKKEKKKEEDKEEEEHQATAKWPKAFPIARAGAWKSSFSYHGGEEEESGGRRSFTNKSSTLT